MSANVNCGDRTLLVEIDHIHDEVVRVNTPIGKCPFKWAAAKSVTFGRDKFAALSVASSFRDASCPPAAALRLACGASAGRTRQNLHALAFGEEDGHMHCRQLFRNGRGDELIYTHAIGRPCEALDF